MNSTTVVIMERLKLYIILGIIAISHFALTFVVALFVLSTVNILNSRLLHFDDISYIEILIMAAIFIMSVFVFFRSFTRVSDYVKKTFFRNSI